MKKIDLWISQIRRLFSEKRLPKREYSAFTLAEIIIVMLVIAVIVGVTIGVTKAKLDNVVSSTYYNAYSTLRKVSAEMLVDYDAGKDEYKAEANEHFIAKVNAFFSNLVPKAFASGGRWVSRPLEGVTDEFTCNQDPKCHWHNGVCYETVYMCPDGGFAREEYTCPSDPGSTPRKCEDPGNCSIYSQWNDEKCACECQDGTFINAGEPCPGECPEGKTWNGSACVTPCTKTCSGGQVLNSSTCTCECPSGTPTTCGKGQHLYNCHCVNDCPSDPGCGKQCDPASGVITDDPSFNRTCSDETYEWSESQCRCVPSPKTLPKKDFCESFRSYTNTKEEACNGSAITSSTEDFTNQTPDIILRNGLRLYNLSQPYGRIDMLDNNTPGGIFTDASGNKIDTASYGYTVYVDIDGEKGSSKIWEDVYPFYITLAGKVIPAYDTRNLGQFGGDNREFLQVSSEDEYIQDGKRHIDWLEKSVDFKTGACTVGYIGENTPYCTAGTPVRKNVQCDKTEHVCRVKQINPIKFFF